MLPVSGYGGDLGQVSALCLMSEKKASLGGTELTTRMFIKLFENSITPWGNMVLRYRFNGQYRKVNLKNTWLESVINSEPSFGIITGKSHLFFQLLCFIVLDKNKKGNV